MNPTVLLIVVLLCGIEVSFTKVISANVLLILVGLVIMLFRQANWRSYVRLFLLPLLPALGVWFSMTYFSVGHDIHFAWVLATRIYAYSFLGAIFTFSTTISQTLASLEQNAHIPTTFVYGMLAALNFVPKIRSEVQTIKVSAQMRGITLHFWSPQLLFKSILAALKWSENLAEAMTSHGFAENKPRTHYSVIKISWWNYLVAIIALAIFQMFLFAGLP
ncbi:energy-coupling factor transporter transmembrane protein EcfT [Ligilactobacillus pobuzihii]|uniref:energy-coupling factor transporter transmembrane component T family protein n=1 Tax=Ligilactobacillus pobuzihii TaxID=449659 RepID=UPI0019D2D397|nr:energy-coupling factor transporter transmembrane component T [Ligilactobacillus pobuzihii]MBN7274850.1 energy-coupling factor transporter transmembrane protein EcfT [Ligilactobacillus pobuzihii]